MQRFVSRRRLALLIALFATLLLPALPASASAGTLPPEGVFEGCDLNSQLLTCVQRLSVIHQGGMQVVVIPAGGSLINMAAYATAAQTQGMKVMWALSQTGWWDGSSVAGYFPGFRAGCDCTSNSGLLSFGVHWLSLLPATYGYYAADDWILPGDPSHVAPYIQAIKAADPHHVVMISAADSSQAAPYQGMADTIGNEIYPVTTDSLMPASQHLADWQSVDQSAADAQRAADRAGKSSTFILQAFTFGDNVDDGAAVGACTGSMTKQQCYDALRYPTPAEQLKLRNEVLLHAHPSLILWWSFPGTYGQSGSDTYSIYPTGATAAARWTGLSAAATAPYPVAPAPTAHAASPRRHRVVRRHRAKPRRRVVHRRR